MIKALTFRLIILTSALTLTLNCYSYTNQQLPDSLQKVLSSSKKDISYINALHEACKILIANDQVLSISYARKAELLSIELEYTKGIAYSQYITGYSYSLLNEYREAFESYLKALQNFTLIDDKYYIAKVCNEIGLIYKDMANYEDAVKFYQKALQNAEAINDKSFSVKLLINTGVVYLKQDKYKEAATYLYRALRLSEDEGNFSQVALIHGNLGKLYMEQEVFTEAENHFSLALNNFRNIGNQRMEALALNNLGEVFTKLSLNEKAITYYNSALKLFNTLNDKPAKADCFKNLGILYMKLENYTSALANYRASLALYLELDNRSTHLAELYALMGGAYLKQGDYGNAKIYLDQAILNEDKITRKIDLLLLYENMYLYHEALANFQNALIYHKKYSELREEVLNNEKLQEINNIETRYRTDKQEQENIQLKNEQEKQRELIGKKEFQNRFLIVGIIFFLFTVVHFYRLNRQRQKNNMLLKERNEEVEIKQKQIVKINDDLQASKDQLKLANINLKDLNIRLNQVLQKKTSELHQTSEELDTFFYQSSHALRRPLVHFKGLLEVLKLEKEEIKVFELHDKLDLTFHKMDVMLSKLVMASEINLEKKRDELVDFHKIISGVWVYLGLKYDTSIIDLKINVEDNLNYYGNNKLVEIFLQNLLENSINFKSIPELRRPEIRIDINSDSDKVKIIFHDNGIGIPQKQLKRVFRMFIVASHLTEGFGLGLYIVSKAIKKLDGEVKVNSQESEYTTFEITLPKNKGLIVEDITFEKKSKRREK
ncbi:MAG: hypothetical protein CMO01_25675 [Thalassobius sp.]|nr:hypothetical protein [Thalassovita sp.]